MADLTYDKGTTGLLLIDPYNDFISEGGKLWNRIKSVAEANHCIPHLLLTCSPSVFQGLCPRTSI